MSLRTAVAHRNLLYLLSLKELRTRYRKSVLGWTWSLLNPISQMVIFSFVFMIVFRAPVPVGDPSGIESFPMYLLVGLLPFQFFSISVTASIQSLEGSSSLIKKVAFPHEHLVFSVVAAQLVTLGIELVVLAIALLFFGSTALLWLPLMIPLMALMSLFVMGVALALSAANLFFHDVKYLWTIVAQVLFYLTPIIYPADFIEEDWLRAITNWGPTGSFIRAAQDIMYDNRMPGLGRWVHLAVISLVTFAAGAWVFQKLSPLFAEEV